MVKFDIDTKVKEYDYPAALKAKARCPLTHKVVSDSQCRDCEVLCTGHPGEEYKELDKKSLKDGRK